MPNSREELIKLYKNQIQVNTSIKEKLQLLKETKIESNSSNYLNKSNFNVNHNHLLNEIQKEKKQNEKLNNIINKLKFQIDKIKSNHQEDLYNMKVRFDHSMAKNMEGEELKIILSLCDKNNPQIKKYIELLKLS